MPFPKLIPLAFLLTAALLFWIAQPFLTAWRKPPPPPEPPRKPRLIPGHKASNILQANAGLENAQTELFSYHAGKPKPVGETYTKMLVIPRTSRENIDWIDNTFGRDPLFQKSIYTVDDVESELHPPRNKGHEVIVYLSHIIQNYENLSDVNIFIHAHERAWHNNDLMDLSSTPMIARLSAERVQREGFMNLRCSWNPGCPDWMHPGTTEVNAFKQEEAVLAKSWSELFPLDPIPDVLAQPCCAQFAISKERIQSLPLARYVYWRDWVLRTKLPDAISGRVFEYVWQFIFAGQTILCPKEHVCYCDGFGICFGGENEFREYRGLEQEVKSTEKELGEWTARMEGARRLLQEGKLEEVQIGELLNDKRSGEIEEKINKLREEAEKRKREAYERGNVAKERAKEVGRPWKDGDGF